MRWMSDRLSVVRRRHRPRPHRDQLRCRAMGNLAAAGYRRHALRRTDRDRARSREARRADRAARRHGRAIRAVAARARDGRRATGYAATDQAAVLRRRSATGEPCPSGAHRDRCADRQSLRPDRNHHPDRLLADRRHGRPARPIGADRPADLEHAGIRARLRLAAGAGRRCGRTVCGGRRSGAGLSGTCGADGGAVRGRPVRTGGQPHVPHRRPGALACRRRARFPWPGRCAGQAARLPHRAGRDRSGAAAA